MGYINPTTLARRMRVGVVVGNNPPHSLDISADKRGGGEKKTKSSMKFTLECAEISFSEKSLLWKR